MVCNDLPVRSAPIPTGTSIAALNLRLHRTSTGDELDEQHNQCDHEQDMDESSQGVRRNDAQQPQNQEDDEYCPKHLFTSGRCIRVQRPFDATAWEAGCPLKARRVVWQNCGWI
jgi:hypothetical protein